MESIQPSPDSGSLKVGPTERISWAHSYSQGDREYLEAEYLWLTFCQRKTQLLFQWLRPIFPVKCDICHRRHVWGCEKIIHFTKIFSFSFMAHMSKFYLNNSIRSCWIIFKISWIGWRCWRAESATDRSSPRNGFEGESNLFKYSKNINQFLAWKFSRENIIFKQ